MNSGSVHGEHDSRLLELDAFRAIAILGVLTHHYLSRYAPPDHTPSLYGYRYSYPQWLDLGAMGVQFFFIISGFVIFMTLERCRHLFEFWARRVARLYPAYMVGTFLTFVIANTMGPAEFHSTVTDALVGLTFFTGYVPGSKFVEPAYWSLAIELKFYFFIGIVYALAGTRFALAWTAYVGAGILLWLMGNSPQWHLLGSLSRHVFLASYVPYFTAGIVFYQLYSGQRRGVWLLAIAALAEYAVATPEFTLAQHVTSAGMILAFALFVSGRLKWLAIRPLVFLGGISYSLYLLHQYIGVSLIPFFTRTWGWPDLAAAGSVSLLCGLLAYVLTRTVEVPAKRGVLSWAHQHLFPSLGCRFPALRFATERWNDISGKAAAAAIAS